jgi:hypothetical protein
MDCLLLDYNQKKKIFYKKNPKSNASHIEAVMLYVLVWPVPTAQVRTHYKIGKLSM